MKNSQDIGKPARPTEPAEANDAGNISRRSLLAGTAGLTIGTLALSGNAAAQHNGQTQLAAHGDHMSSLSARAYPVEVEGGVDISHDPTDLPPPITRREPETVQIELETRELEARLSDNATFRFWTFNSRVPGPVRSRAVGDTVAVAKVSSKCRQKISKGRSMGGKKEELSVRMEEL